MPIYEYRCTSCARTLEVLQRVDDPPPSECPDCGARMEKLFSAPAFQFKGSGWYATDYAGRKPASGDGAEASSDSSSSATGESSTADAKASGDGAPAT